MHCQQQFNAACARTHYRNRGFSLVRFDSMKQGQPAVIEALNRLDGYRVFCSTRNLMQLRCRADVDRKLVIRHRWAIAAQHFLVCAIQADHFITVQTRTCKHRQTAQVDMYLIVVIVPRHIAWQHAGIGRMHVGADEREAHARDRLHAETLQHAYVAVPAAYQHDVSEDRLISCLH